MEGFLKLSTAVNITILAIDSADHVTGKTGLSAGFTIYATKAAGAPATITPTVTELDSTNVKGLYKLALTSAHSDTLGELTLHITGTGMDPLDLKWQVSTYLPGEAASLQADQAVNVTKWNGTAVSVPTVAGVPNVNVKTWNDLTTVELPLVPTTAGRKLDVSAGGEAGVDWANVGSPTTVVGLTGTTMVLADGVAHGGTLGSSTATLALSRMSVVSQSANTAAVTVTGNGTGNGATIGSGSGATGTGLQVSGNSTDGHAVQFSGSGSGSGLRAAGGPTGNGGLFVGGSAGGHGLRAQGTAGNAAGISAAGQGTNAGISSTGGATGAAMELIGGGTSGDGLKVTTTSGHGINLAPVGTSKHGFFSTGGNGGTSDGMSLAAGTGGVDLRANQTGNLVGTVSTLTTYTGNTPQTGDSFARIGAPAGASVSADVAAIKTVVDTIATYADTEIAAIKAKTDNLPEGIQKNTALNNFEFFMADSADHVTGKTGLTVAVARSIDGGAFAASTNTPATEVASGIYKINLSAADLNGDVVTFRMTSAGADATLITIKTEV